ncbi:MAG: hypothetical protein QM405_04585 [Euryarchaeota archaeon]|nr:hypothetical protein [Euryarchaeota archaeon]
MNYYRPVGHAVDHIGGHCADPDQPYTHGGTVIFHCHQKEGRRLE